MLESGGLCQTHHGVLALYAPALLKPIKEPMDALFMIPFLLGTRACELCRSLLRVLRGVRQAPRTALRPPFHHPGRCILLHMRTQSKKLPRLNSPDPLLPPR